MYIRLDAALLITDMTRTLLPHTQDLHPRLTMRNHRLILMLHLHNPQEVPTLRLMIRTNLQLELIIHLQDTAAILQLEDMVTLLLVMAPNSLATAILHLVTDTLHLVMATLLPAMAILHTEQTLLPLEPIPLHLALTANPQILPNLPLEDKHHLVTAHTLDMEVILLTVLPLEPTPLHLVLMVNLLILLNLLPVDSHHQDMATHQLDTVTLLLVMANPHQVLMGNLLLVTIQMLLLVTATLLLVMEPMALLLETIHHNKM